MEAGKVLYIVVVEEEVQRHDGKESFRYTRPVLQSTLQFMGCKARHAFKISQRVFDLIRMESVLPLQLKETDTRTIDASKGINMEDVKGIFSEPNSHHCSFPNGYDEKIRHFDLYKKRTTVVVGREVFLNVVCDALTEYKYVGPNQRADLVLACRIREKRESVTVLLCGTSGCGKSTLSSLLGSRLGITTVISTDSIRHMMRSFVDEKDSPLLWASTYHAGDCLDQEAVSEAKAKRKAKKLAGREDSYSKHTDHPSNISRGLNGPPSLLTAPELVSQKQMAVEGFKAQSEMVVNSLDQLITAWEQRKESVIVEGVHLSLNFVMGLMKKHPSIIPFMIFITSETKHLERFAVRAKYMTLDPTKNKYAKYIKNIRTIQDYLCDRADKHLVPKINNTNVDKSVAAIHATVFSCLRRREAGEQLYDPTTNTVSLIDEEYRNQCSANSLGSKGMFQLIQRKGSSRHLMALLNTDGSVAKAWHLNPPGGSGGPWAHESEIRGGIPMNEHVQISKAEPVNLQFGLFGISAWPNDGGTSHTSSIDESRTDMTETGSRYYSSCCSSPRISDGGAAKDLKEELSVHGSDEDIDEQPEADTDDELTDIDNRNHDEIGSIDEESKSDDEYDDLALQAVQDNGYFKDEVRVPPDENLCTHGSGNPDNPIGFHGPTLFDGKKSHVLTL